MVSYTRPTDATMNPFHPRLTGLALSILVATTGATTQAAPAAEPAAADREVVELDAQANAAYQAGAYESAAKLFTELHERTKDPNYLYNISVCYDRMGELQKALDALDAYAAQAPDHDEDAVASKRRGLEIRLETESREDTEDEESAEQDSAPEPVPAAAASTTDDEPIGRSKPLDIAGGVALGLGVTSVAIGIGLGVVSNDKKSQVESGCVQGDAGLICPDDQRANSDDAKSFALGADIAIIAGGALAATGIALLVVNTVRAKKSRNVAVAPALGPRMTGLAVAGHF